MGEETKPNYRMERIDRLLHELRYEIERGMMEREVDETLGFEFIVPISRSIPNGIVHCSFRTRPTSHVLMMGEPKLKVVK